ncbi:MAG: transcriptional regulator NrdR [Sulfuricaulis sp.]
MRCPFCSADETRVVDSRLSDEGDSVRRRRECEVCGERFTTFERAELRLPQVIKTDGRREPFNDKKLHNGLSRALEKRPVDTDAIEKIIGRVRHKLMASGEGEIPSRRIGEWIMEELKDLDPVAYVRFASVYRSFQDLNAFRDEVQRLQDEPSAELRRKQLSLIPEPEPPSKPESGRTKNPHAANKKS